MARKKTQTTTVLPIPEAPFVQKENYKIGLWAGIPQYRCDLCAFDTLEGSDILRHLNEVHGVGTTSAAKEVVVENVAGEEPPHDENSKQEN